MQILGVDGDAEVPASAVKSLREEAGLSQVSLAAKSGLSQALITAVEVGQRDLSMKSARAIAPALGADSDDLLLAEEISSLKRAAAKGRLHPRTLFETILEMVYDDEELEEELLDALVSVLKQALDSYGGTSKGVAAKSAAEDPEAPRRDAYGRRINKRHDPRKAQGGVDRDSLGRNRNKRHDPRRQ